MVAASGRPNLAGPVLCAAMGLPGSVAVSLASANIILAGLRVPKKITRNPSKFKLLLGQRSNYSTPKFQFKLYETVGHPIKP